MATPDLSSLASSGDIFSNYSLPQIRSIHASIHTQVEEKAARLRTQVGNSYRELLGTADTIVRMRGDNHVVQDLLSNMGSRCGRATIESKISELEAFISEDEKPFAVEAARLKLLDSSLLVGSRILKGGGGLPATASQGDRLILTAKVWVLSRLLIKSLGEAARGTRLRRAVDAANKTVAGLRRRFMGGIKRVLRKPGEDAQRDDVLKALCAYGIATSSGAHDVLRFFLAVRGEAMALPFNQEGEIQSSTQDVVQGLKLYTRTILDVQALVPFKLSPALLSLKQRPLLADPALRQLEGLPLDIYERWTGDDIHYYTPFILHDDLNGNLARDRLSSWAAGGAEVLLNGLRKTLAAMTNFNSVVGLRTSVLQLWIRDGGKAKGFDPLEMQNELRAAINARLLAVLVSKVGQLRLVGSEVRATLESWNAAAGTRVALWDNDGYDSALARGAVPFVEEVVCRLYGRTDGVSRAVRRYEAWFQVIGDVKEVVNTLRKQRWDNDYEEIEDEETIEARQQLLSKDDPKMLQDRLDTALDKSFRELQEQLQSLWNERRHDAGRHDTPSGDVVAMYLLRVLRDIRENLPERPSVQSFGLSMVPILQSTVAAHVSASALESFEKNSLSERRVVVKPLWEGEPPVPGQASPGFFRFLHDLSLSMMDAGVDLWTPAAAMAMKKHLGNRLPAMWRAALLAVASESDGGAQGNGGSKPEADDGAPIKEDGKGASPQQDNAAEDWRRDLYVQWAFDAGLLKECLVTSSKTAPEAVESLLGDLYRHAGLEGGHDSRQRIGKAAHDFWQRTSLLFGLLA